MPSRLYGWGWLTDWDLRSGFRVYQLGFGLGICMGIVQASCYCSSYLLYGKSCPYNHSE